MTTIDRWTFATAKATCEHFCYAYAKMGLKMVILRYFNTYGPRMAESDGRVVSNFIVQALRGQPLTLYGEGTQTRSFCYVDDLVNGLIRLMNAAACR